MQRRLDIYCLSHSSPAYEHAFKEWTPCFTAPPCHSSRPSSIARLPRPCYALPPHHLPHHKIPHLPHLSPFPHPPHLRHNLLDDEIPQGRQDQAVQLPREPPQARVHRIPPPQNRVEILLLALGRLLRLHEGVAEVSEGGADDEEDDAVGAGAAAGGGGAGGGWGGRVGLGGWVAFLLGGFVSAAY